jgi:transcriptional regulator
LILHTLSEGPCHGYRIAKQIKQQSEGVLDFKEGTLYPTLHNLEEHGFLEAYSMKEKGRTRRYYRLTDSGRASLARERESWERYARAVNLVLEGTS